MSIFDDIQNAINPQDARRFLPPEARLGAAGAGLLTSHADSLLNLLQLGSNAAKDVSGPGFYVSSKTNTGPAIPIIAPHGIIPGGPLSGNSDRVQSTWEEVRKRQAQGTQGRELYDEAMQNTGVVDRLAREVAYDPLSYAGLGLPGKIGTPAAQYAGLLTKSPIVAGRVADAFNILQKVDTAVVELPWKAVSGTVGTGLEAVGKIPVYGKLKMTKENATVVPVSTLGEWAGATSKHGQFKKIIRQVEDLVAHLKNTGRDVESDIQRESQHRTFLDDLRNPTGSVPTLEKKREESLIGLQHFSSTLAAKGDVYSNALIYAGHDLINSAWKRALGIAEKHGESNPIAQRAIDNAYLDSMAILLALEQAEKKTPEEVAALLKGVDPAHLATAAIDTKAAGSTVDTAINAVRNQMGGKFLTSVSGDVNELAIQDLIHSSAINTHSNVLNSLSTAHGSDITTPLLENAYKSILSSVGESQAVRKGLPSITSAVPDQMKGTATREWGNLKKWTNNIIKDRNVITKALSDAWKAKMGNAPIPGDITSLKTIAPEERYNEINKILTGMGLPSVTKPTELLDVLKGEFVGDTARFKRLNEAITRWESGDVIKDDTYTLIGDALGRDKRELFGVDTKSGAANLALNIWKELSLTTISYPITNLFSAVVAGSFEHVDPVRTLYHFFQNLGPAMKGQPYTVSTLENAARLSGQDIPAAAKHSSGLLETTVVQEYVGNTGVSASQKIGMGKMAIGGGAVGAVSGALQPDVEDRNQAILTNAAVGTALGAALPHMSFYIRRLSAGIETTVRQEAYLHRFLTEVETRLTAPGGLHDILDEALGRGAVSSVLDPATGQRTVVSLANSPATRAGATAEVTDKLSANQAAYEATSKFAAAKGGLISAQDVENILIKYVPDEAIARRAAARWKSQLEEASQAGLGFSNKIHVDYEVLSNAEQFIKTAAPFSTWPVKMSPFFAQHILENPAVALTLYKLDQLSAEDVEKNGLTQRFEGSVPMGLGSALFSAILGRPVTSYINPLRGFIPFSDVGKSLNQAQDTENPVEKGLSIAQAVGLSPHPALAAVLRLATKSPPSGYLRQGEPLRGIEALAGLNKGRGYDLNAITTTPERVIRTALTGEEPPDLREAAIQKRVDELALSQTGYPIQSNQPSVGPYVQAKSSRSGPIWDQAAREVGQEKGAASSLGFVSQFLSPQAILSPQEADIRRNQSAQRTENASTGIDVLRTQVQTLAAQDKNADATGQLKADIWKYIAQTGPYSKEDMSKVENLMHDGTIGAMEEALNVLSPIDREAPAQGYQSGGTPLHGQLTREFATWKNPSAILTEAGIPDKEKADLLKAWKEYDSSPKWAQEMYKKDKKYGGAPVNKIMELQKAYRAAHPLLDGYLNYRDSQDGGGNINEYITLVKGR